MAVNAKLQAKALAAESKSAGMRILLEAGATVSEVRDIFEAPYGFVYGVATRGGFVTPTARVAKAPAAKAAKAPAKATKAAASAKPAPRTKAAVKGSTAKAKAAKAKA